MLDPTGHFGSYGGAYLPEVLVPVMQELDAEFHAAIRDPEFLKELTQLRTEFCGRPTPLTYAKNLTQKLGGAQIFIKNEGLNHTGAHKMNHCLGQILLAKRMGKTRVIAETGAGQHGMATATVCAKFGLECVIYMGKKDYDRQRPNVFWMETLGATVIPVYDGGQVLRDAVNAAIRDLICNPTDTLYLLGTVCGPHPYPVMNTYFQKVIGEEVREQLVEFVENKKEEIRKKKNTGLLVEESTTLNSYFLTLNSKNVLPNSVVACLGGGSNAMGIFYDFLDDESVELVAVEAGGKGITENENGCEHAARFQTGQVGVVEGFKSYFLQSDDGQIKGTHSISAGLDYSGVGPQHAYLRDIERVQYTYATDDEVLAAFKTLAETEGILAAMESSHAVAETIKRAPQMKPDEIIVCHVSGRGEKDLFITAPHFDKTNFHEFLRNHLNNA